MQLIVFDWDGTLMDSEAQITAAMQSAYRQLGVDVPPASEIRAIIGLELLYAIEQISPDLDDKQRDTLARGYRENHRQAACPSASLFEGVIDTLTELSELGYLLAVATGKSRAGLEQALIDVDLQGTFAASRCADETLGKPHPAMLQEIMADLDVPPEKTLMIGDTEYDLMMAQRAGTHAAAVTYGAHDVTRLLEYAPAFVLDDIRKLIQQINKLCSGSPLDSKP